MDTWNEIITEPATPEERLKKLIGLWSDIITMYGNPPMMYFDSANYTAVMNGNYNRALYPSNTTSMLRSGTGSDTVENVDMTMKLIVEDDRNYRLVNALAGIFNRTLDKEQRELIVRSLFYRENVGTVCDKCGLSERSYYRLLRKAKQQLIMKYCLDHYDEYGMEKHSWLDVCRDRMKWNKGHFFKEDVHDWPEFMERG